MVKKLVLQMEGKIDPQSSIINQQPDYKNILLLNDALLEIVTKYKNKITDYYRNRSWDRFKKLSNEYEHVFYSPNATSNISLYNPVSRSFFKLWEILYDFEDVLNITQPIGLKCVFLAEGPGGFFEAFHKRRRELGLDACDNYYGITLKSNNNKNIPDWKTQTDLPITISYGKDGTGNLYNVQNIFHFAEHVGLNTVDFITADGGFDFSSNFNNQEEQSYRLIVSEVLAALLLQKNGGSFLLKVYDCFNLDTLRLIQVLKYFYDVVYIIKPLTSRPANSERYLLCHGFKQKDDVGIYITMLKNVVSEATPHLDLQLAYSVVYYVVLYNMYYTIRQVFYIQRTINYINFFKKQSEDTVMSALMEKHTEKSRKWCKKYHIPFKE